MLTPATEADYPAVVDLANRAYRGTGPEASWNVENVIEGQRIDESLLRDDLAASPEAQLLLWRANDSALLGCVRLEALRQHEPAGAWYLSLLAVDPRRQNQQLGRTMLAAAEAFSQTRGAGRIRMSVVFLRDTLIAWYLRRGYTLTGETEPFPYGDERFGRPLRDDLYFVILEKELQP
jgi:ribosomal protein S18 acetylase RimI-like enzyme